MCGIFGVVSKTSEVTNILLDGLKRLEYRGYDSSGIATLKNNKIYRIRAVGKVVQLEKQLSSHILPGKIGIGHTRWATHGQPSTENAHPHMSQDIAIVHNGIIENYHIFRNILEKQGICFKSETDTEIIVHLLENELAKGKTPLESVQIVLPQLKGAFALVVLFRKYPNILLGARRGSPLVIGYGNNEMFFGSDAFSLAPLTQKLCYLEDGDYVILTHDKSTIYNNEIEMVRSISISHIDGSAVKKDGYRHFMLKEICEQPVSLSNTLSNFVDFTNLCIKDISLPVDPKKITRIIFTACGSAFYACLVAKYWLEQFSDIIIEVDIASELRYRNIIVSPGNLAIFVSQSGETMDTLESLRYLRGKKQKTLSIVNVPESTLARESDCCFLTQAGPEIGVASTKALTTQLVVLACLTIFLAKARGQLLNERQMVTDLVTLPRLFSEVLANRTSIENVVEYIVQAHDILYIGRGLCYPIALEGALKLKEVSYLHAEGYAAGELKHGPIALIEDGTPVICLMPSGPLFKKIYSNVCEVVARNGRVICIIEEGTVLNYQSDVIVMPKIASWLAPILYTLPVQILAYEVAVRKNTDVDKPRNLAKSVTVE